MDGYISDCDMELETWSSHDSLLVDDAGWDDTGIRNRFPHELGVGKVWNKRAACNVINRNECYNQSIKEQEPSISF